MTAERPAMDEVDRIVRAWQQLQPDLNSTPLHVFSRISRIAWIQENLRRDVFAKVGLDGWEFDVLSALRRAGEPFQLTPRLLIQETLVTSGTMTTRLDKLQARGLVTRARAPEDGRSVVVQLSAEGIRLADEAISALMDAEQEFLDALPAGAQEQMGDALRSLLLALEAPADAEDPSA